MHDFSYNYFHQLIVEHPKYKNLSEKKNQCVARGNLDLCDRNRDADVFRYHRTDSG